MALNLAPLPFEADALEPFMSAETLSYHHGRHHATYVASYNALVKDTPYADKPLADVLTEIVGNPEKQSIFNNGAQAWNHAFFWTCLTPNGGGKPSRSIAAKIDSDLGGYDKFVETFKSAATGQFGSGWAWLILDNGKLKVTKTANADTPVAHGQTPLLALDVWEHAYYLDYQNRRPDFVQAFLDHLLNWRSVERVLEKKPAKAA